MDITPSEGSLHLCSSFCQVFGKAEQIETIDHPIAWYTTLSSHFDTPLSEINLRGGMSIGIDAEHASEVQCALMPTPVQVQTPWVGIDLNCHAMFYTCRQDLFDINVVSGAS